jgi:hypothetical protein
MPYSSASLLWLPSTLRLLSGSEARRLSVSTSSGRVRAAKGYGIVPITGHARQPPPRVSSIQTGGVWFPTDFHMGHLGRLAHVWN